MSLAPIEAGALRQNKLTDHFFVAPTDRRFWDKVHKSRSLGLRRYINVIYWGLGSSAWVASKAFFNQRYLAEHVRPITDHQFSSELTPHHCDSGDMFRAEQHRRGRILLNTSPTGLSSRGVRPLL